MSKYAICRICNEYHFDDNPCKPVYIVHHNYYTSNDGTKIHASGHEEAAIKYAKKYNSEGSLIDADPIQVKVVHNNIEIWYEVSAEDDIHYTSDEIDNPDI